MELQIMTSMDPGVLPEIQWNNEELKAEITLQKQRNIPVSLIQMVRRQR